MAGSYTGSPQYPDFSDEETPSRVHQISHLGDDPDTSTRNCHECRRKKRKCDKALPTCSLCARNGVPCDYETVYEKSPANKKRASLKASALNDNGSETPSTRARSIQGSSRLNSPMVPGRPSSMQSEIASPVDSEPSDPSGPVDPENLYPSQPFTTIAAFKQHVLAIAEAQGWTPYIRRSDRRGAEIRCHSIENPHKPRTPEFNKAGCQFRVAARTWPDERKSKADQLKQIERDTPGRWGDGSEPARVTMVQPEHICGIVKTTGRADENGEEEARVRAAREAKERSEAAALKAELGRGKDIWNDKPPTLDSPEPLQEEQQYSSEAQRFAAEALGESNIEDSELHPNGNKDGDEVAVPKKRKRKSTRKPSEETEEAEFKPRGRGRPKRRRVSDSAIDEAAQPAKSNTRKRPRKSEPVTRQALNIEDPVEDAGEISILDNPPAQEPIAEPTTLTSSETMIRKPISQLIEEVPSLFANNPNWFDEVRVQNVVIAAKEQWNCYIGPRQARNVLNQLKEEKKLMESTPKPTIMETDATAQEEDEDEDELSFNPEQEEEEDTSIANHDLSDDPITVELPVPPPQTDSRSAFDILNLLQQNGIQPKNADELAIHDDDDGVIEAGLGAMEAGKLTIESFKPLVQALETNDIRRLLAIAKGEVGV